MKRVTNPKLLLTIGLAALALGLIIERFLPSNPGLNFTEGFLFAISIVFIIRFMVAYRNARKN